MQVQNSLYLPLNNTIKIVPQHSMTDQAVREETIQFKSTHKLVFYHVMFTVEAKD